MSILVKQAGLHFPTFEIVLIRSIIQLTLAVLWCLLFLKIHPFGPPGLNKWWLVARGTAGATGLTLFYFVVVNMALGDGMSMCLRVWGGGGVVFVLFVYIACCDG